MPANPKACRQCSAPITGRGTTGLCTECAPNRITTENARARAQVAITNRKHNAELAAKYRAEHGEEE